MLTLECDNTTLQLKNPTFPRRVLKPQVVVRRTMAGGIRSFKQSPVKMEYSVDILLLSKEKIDEFESFFLSFPGRQFKCTLTELTARDDPNNAVPGHREPAAEDVFYAYLTKDPIELVEEARTSSTVTLILESNA